MSALATLAVTICPSKLFRQAVLLKWDIIQTVRTQTRRHIMWSLVDIESKSYYSPLNLHLVQVLQKVCVWIHKTSASLRRFFWVPTKHCILRNIPYIGNPTCHIFYSTYGDASMYQNSRCRGFTPLLQLLKSKNSVQTCFAINNTFASSANMSK